MATQIEESFHLENAPIVEAIIDFRIRPPENFSHEVLDSLQKAIAEKYSHGEPIRVFSTELGMKDGVPIQSSLIDSVIGYRYESQDKTHVFQANKDGFTVSRLKPYVTWDHLRDEALWLWEPFRSLIKPTSIIRTAVRYINRIELKAPLDFDDYFSCFPKVPENLPQVVDGFLSRIVVPCDRDGTKIVITQTLEGINPLTASLQVILDIDVFLENAFDADDHRPWEILEELRKLKNRAFFGCITHKTVELFS